MNKEFELRFCKLETMLENLAISVKENFEETWRKMATKDELAEVKNEVKIVSKKLDRIEVGLNNHEKRIVTLENKVL